MYQVILTSANKILKKTGRTKIKLEVKNLFLLFELRN